MSQSKLNTTQEEALSFFDSELTKRWKKDASLAPSDFYRIIQEIADSFGEKYGVISDIDDFPNRPAQPTGSKLPVLTFFLGFSFFLKLLGRDRKDLQEPAIPAAANSFDAYRYTGHSRLDVKDTEQAYSILLD